MENLVDILRCPDCRGRLRPEENALRCGGCARTFPVEDQIPLLYPLDLDRQHLEEEEKLGEKMIGGSGEREPSFSDRQWEKSKIEFWSYVREETSSVREGIFINIGCGVDRGFLDLRRPGIELAGLDIVPSLLKHLMESGELDAGIAGCVHRLPFRENSFDCLCCIDLIHHEWERSEMILEKFHEILKPGGILFLEDINAWGLGQFHKSILLPKPVHRVLRRLYHRIKGSENPPAEYEFPTSVFKTARTLRRLGFIDISTLPLNSYPNAGQLLCRFWRLAASLDRARRYHNFHYMISARKSRG
ncbi:MAG: methyltransferase domain-containing protein [Candidatus Krumholzibacteriota bacterium]